MVGTWGGRDAGLIATDTGAHPHTGCTLGNVAGPVTLDAGGRFDVPAFYNITAYPVDPGTVHPARRAPAGPPRARGAWREPL